MSSVAAHGDVGGQASDAQPWERPLGAHPVGDDGTEFRVWAHEAETVGVRIGRTTHSLQPAGGGVFEGRVGVGAGTDYRYVVRRRSYPDPCSRHQPEGLRGPSRVVDPGAYAWTDHDFAPRPLREHVLYELHVGTFTQAGTLDGAIDHLPQLAELGVTAVELMPVSEFPGIHGWGYDGVYLGATHSAYGGPDALQRFVDAAHGAGLAVVLDLVPNHVGASGNKALRAFGPYFTDRYGTFWGEAINYDDADCGPVREWLVQAAEFYVRDLHVDGLRLDAIHAVYDEGADHVLAALADRVRVARDGAFVIAESGLNDPKVIRPREQGGWGHDGQWADDFHHALRVLLTGDRDGYYADFGTVADLAKTYRRPYLHDGTYSEFRKRRHGAPAGDRPPGQFVVFAQNHDQVGNRAFGDRLPHDARPLAAFATLLSPFVPMLFMGEEYGEDAPFRFFCDHIDEPIATATREGRRKEFAAFASFAEAVPDPQDPATFHASKLTRVRDEALATLYRDLIAARADVHGEAHPVFDEDARWLVVDRREHRLAMNFASAAQAVPAGDRQHVVLATAEADLDRDAVTLPPMSGALLR